MASSNDRFRKIADRLGENVLNLLVEKDVNVKTVLLALEDLKLCDGDKFLEVTTEQLRDKKVPQEDSEKFQSVQRDYKAKYTAGGGKTTSEQPQRFKHYPDSKETHVDERYFYKMDPKLKSHGLLIINEIFDELNDRKIAENELKSLRKTAELFNIDMDCLQTIDENIPESEIGEAIERFARMGEKSNLVFIAIFSHGHQRNKICGKDYSFEYKYPVLSISKIEKLLADCESLVYIPKIFLIQTCMGGKMKEEISDEGYDETDHVPVARKATCTSDAVIMHASGNDEDLCNPVNNEPFFLKVLNECLKENKSCHFAEILTMLSRKIAEKSPINFKFTFQSSLQGFLQL